MTFSDVFHAALYIPIVAILIALLRKYIYGISERALKDVVPFLRRIISEDLQNLLDPEVEEYIKTTLPNQEFKRTQWKRIRLALQYLGDLSENATIFQTWGKYERSLSLKYPDPDRKRVSLELITACVQSRICTLLLRSRLHWWLVRMAFLPFLPPPSFAKLQNMGSFDVFVFYERVKAAAVQLSQGYGEAPYEELLLHLQ